MKKLLVAQFAVIGVLSVAGWVFIATLKAERPPAPPPGSPIKYPWGSMHVDEDQDEPDSELEETIAESFKSEPKGEFDPDRDGVTSTRFSSSPAEVRSARSGRGSCRAGPSPASVPTSRS